MTWHDVMYDVWCMMYDVWCMIHSCHLLRIITHVNVALNKTHATYAVFLTFQVPKMEAGILTFFSSCMDTAYVRKGPPRTPKSSLVRYRKPSSLGPWNSIKVVVEPTPLQKYARQNGFIFPNFRGEHKKYLKNHHPVLGECSYPHASAHHLVVAIPARSNFLCFDLLVPCRHG